MQDFLPLPENENYLISPEGKIFSLYVNREIKTYLGNRGYYEARIQIEGKQYCTGLHRLLARVFLNLPSLYSDLEVDHKDTNKLNNNLNNLQVMTTENHRLKTYEDLGLNSQGVKLCLTCGKRLEGRNKRGYCVNHIPVKDDIKVDDII